MTEIEKLYLLKEITQTNAFVFLNSFILFRMVKLLLNINFIDIFKM